MRTRTYILVILLICPWLLACCSATGVSAPTNGVYLALGAYRNAWPVTNEPIRFDDRLIWAAFCSTGRVRLATGSPEYAMKITLRGPGGKEVPKTPQGLKFGSNAERVHTDQDCRLGGFEAAGDYKDDPMLLEGYLLPAPKDLFRIRKPGIYTLEFRVQAFLPVASAGPRPWVRKLFWFPPVRIKVEKPPDP